MLLCSIGAWSALIKGLLFADSTNMPTLTAACFDSFIGFGSWCGLGFEPFWKFGMDPDIYPAN